MFVSRLEVGQSVTAPLGRDRGGYLYVIDGEIRLGDQTLGTGDAVKIYEEPDVVIAASETSELIVVDVPLTYTPVGIWAQ